MNTDTPDATDPTATPADTGVPTDQPDPGREAAKYRRKLRETETERDGLRGQLEGLRRSEVERVAGAYLDRPRALWASGVAIADLLDDDGTVSPEKVATAATEAAETLGLRAPMQGNYVAREGGNPTLKANPHADMLRAVMGG